LYIRLLPALLLCLTAGPARAAYREFREGRCLQVPGEGSNAPLSQCAVSREYFINDEKLRERDLRGVELTGGGANRSHFERVQLEKAHLGDTSWDSVEILDSNFFAADLRGARWTNSRCDGCDLTGVDARSVSWAETTFARSSLRGSRLAGAVLERVVFRDCDFRGADLHDALWLRTRCVRCRADASTLLPWPRSEAEHRGFIFE
jgi:uncharacterized protein YjbI with pentapeptide repeats